MRFRASSQIGRGFRPFPRIASGMGSYGPGHRTRKLRLTNPSRIMLQRLQSRGFCALALLSGIWLNRRWPRASVQHEAGAVSNSRRPLRHSRFR